MQFKSIIVILLLTFFVTHSRHGKHAAQKIFKLHAALQAMFAQHAIFRQSVQRKLHQKQLKFLLSFLVILVY